MTALPDGNPKTAVGRLKPSLRAIPPAAIISMGLAMEEGERKYGLTNWRDRSISASVYYEAALRHLLAWWDGEDVTPIEQSTDVDGNPITVGGIPHLAHVMACMAILVDGEMCNVLNDDRPGVKGPTGEFLRMLHEQRKAAAQPVAAQLRDAVDEINADRPFDAGGIAKAACDWWKPDPVDVAAAAAVEKLDGDSLQHRTPKSGEPMMLDTASAETLKPTLEHWGD